MQKSWMFKVLGLGLMAGVYGAVGAGCGDDEPQALSDAGTKQQCGATVGSMNGNACTEDGLDCSVVLQCANGEHQVAHCDCTGGEFECYVTNAETGTQDRWTSDDEPTCSPIGAPNGPSCGSSVSDIEGRNCDTLRDSCRYASAPCEGEIAGQFDVCDCKQNPVGDQIWICTVNTCGEPSSSSGGASSSSGGSSSGGSSSGGTDGGSDASDL